MKKTILYVVLGCLFAFLFTSCDRRKAYIPFDPMTSFVDATYLLSFGYDNSKAGDYYFVALRRVPKRGHPSHDCDYSKAALFGYVKVEIGDTLVALKADQTRCYDDYWISDRSYRLTSRQKIKLKIDNRKIVETHINTINKAKVAFPDNYNYYNPTTLHWTLDEPNNYQFIGKELMYPMNDSTAYYYLPIFVKRISNIFQSYVIPSRIAYDWQLSSAEYVKLFVEEVNFKIVNNIAIMVYQCDSQSYRINSHSNSKTGINPDNRDRITEIANIISRFEEDQQ